MLESDRSARPSVVPDRITPVIGWRVWTVDADGWLHSLHQRRADRWPGGRALVARCALLGGPWFDAVRGRQLRETVPPPPHPGCDCGVYAARDLETAAAYVETWSARIAVGRVALWGRIEEHEHGWRAEHAYPVALSIPDTADPTTALALGSRYGVPVVISDLAPLRSAAVSRTHRRSARFLVSKVVGTLIAAVFASSFERWLGGPGWVLTLLAITWVGMTLSLAPLVLLLWARQTQARGRDLVVARSASALAFGAGVGAALWGPAEIIRLTFF